LFFLDVLLYIGSSGGGGGGVGDNDDGGRKQSRLVIENERSRFYLKFCKVGRELTLTLFKV